jgi:hypothetical protein
MTKPGARVRRKQEQAIAALLTETTILAAAAKAEVDVRTLKRWLTLPDFSEAYRAARHEILDRAVTRLLGACDDAVGTLQRNLRCGDAGPENRAAVAVLGLAVRGMEVHDLARQVSELKKQLEESRSGNRNLGPTGRPAASSGSRLNGNGQPAAGPAAAGPGGDPRPGGDDAGPVAGEPASLPLFPPDAAL